MDGLTDGWWEEGGEGLLVVECIVFEKYCGLMGLIVYVSLLEWLGSVFWIAPPKFYSRNLKSSVHR